ncbi:MAG: hypothetical protein ACLPGW_19410 [Roseiarcus sp.]
MTNVLALPQLSGSLTIATNSDLRAALAFTSAAGGALDLTGISFRMQVRPAAGSEEIALDLSTDNGLLINGGTSGVLSWLVPAAQVGQIAPGPYVADLVASGDGAIVNFCQNGPLTVTVVEGVTC